MTTDEFTADLQSDVPLRRSREQKVSFSYGDFVRTRAKVTFALDVSIIFLVGIVAAFLRWGFPSRYSLGLSQGFSQTYLIFLIPAAWFIALAWENAWIFSGTWSPVDVYGRVLRAGIITLCAVAGISFTFKENFSRLYVLLVIFIGTTLLLIQRMLMRKHFERRCQKEGMKKAYLVIACCSPLTLVKKIELDFPNSLYSSLQIDAKTQLPLDFLREIIENRGIDAVVLCHELATDSLKTTQLIHLFDQLDCEIYLPESLGIVGQRRGRVIQGGDAYTILREPRIQHSQAQFKRLLDIFIASIALLLLSPLMLVLAIAVKATGKGPVLYKDFRVGQGNREFMFPKFRTMRRGADADRLAVLGRPDENMSERYKVDPRITRIGKLLRRFSLDELPQFFCVLIGTMSIVGPRPILIQEIPQLKNLDSYRHLARPGLTGLWQISGRKETTWEERMALDLEYVHNWSPITDFILILRTVRVVISGKGAY